MNKPEKWGYSLNRFRKYLNYAIKMHVWGKNSLKKIMGRMEEREDGGKQDAGLDKTR